MEKERKSQFSDCFTFAEVGSPLVVTACEDDACETRAGKVVDQLTDAATNAGQIENQVWRFELLEIPPEWDAAREAASRADLIIISALGRHAFPPPVKRWIESWALAQPAMSARVLGLFQSGPSEAVVCDLCGAFLADAARRAKLDYFVQLEGDDCHEMDFSPATLAARSQKGSSVLDRFLTFPEGDPELRRGE